MYIQAYTGSLAVLAAALIWGTTGTAAAYAPNLSPLAIGAFAMGFGGLLQAFIAKRSIQRYWRNILQQRFLLGAGVLSVAIYPLAFYSSMHYAGITIGTVISIGTAPIFSALLERLFNHQLLSTRWVISFILGVLGIVLLTVSDTHSRDTVTLITASNKPLGILLGLIAGATYSTYSWAAKQFIRQGFNAKAAMGSIFGLAAFILIPSLFWTAHNLFDEARHLYVVTYMAIIPMFLGYVLFGYGLKTVSASYATTLTLFEPVVAAFFAAILMNEKIAMLGWIGIVMIFACLLILSSKKAS